MATAARLGMVVFDSQDPVANAAFWAELLDWRVDAEWSSDDWVTIRGPEGALGFQLAPELTRSTWPDPSIPQQAHLDVYASDVAATTERAVALGATELDSGRDDHDTLRILADPAGHPFCIC